MHAYIHSLLEIYFGIVAVKFVFFKRSHTIVIDILSNKLGSDWSTHYFEWIITLIFSPKSNKIDFSQPFWSHEFLSHSGSYKDGNKKNTNKKYVFCPCFRGDSFLLVATNYLSNIWKSPSLGRIFSLFIFTNKICLISN